jgi:hypothetical protein
MLVLDAVKLPQSVKVVVKTIKREINQLPTSQCLSVKKQLTPDSPVRGADTTALEEKTSCYF